MKMQTFRWRAFFAVFRPSGQIMRSFLPLAVGLMLAQIVGISLVATDHPVPVRNEELRVIANQAIGLYRTMVTQQADARPAALAQILSESNVIGEITENPPVTPVETATQPIFRLIHAYMLQTQMPPVLRPREMILRGGAQDDRVTVALEFPEGRWLNLTYPLTSNLPWHTPEFWPAFGLMLVTSLALSLWVVWRMNLPVRVLAQAAEQLGRDVNAPPLPEAGSEEFLRAAKAFNTMASRIRLFVRDRTLLLTAIGHDLRTPVTRLKLRAEFLADTSVRDKIFADLDELEQMVAATLAFGRDTADDEPAAPVDMMALLRTVIDEAADASPQFAEKLSCSGPETLVMTGRLLSLKRAFGNLIGNAIKYGGSAEVEVARDADELRVTVTDDGVGIPADLVERVFDPFFRIESSRNRETGGTGLGLAIARNILRAHGGDVAIGNTQNRGAKVLITLPLG